MIAAFYSKAVADEIFAKPGTRVSGVLMPRKAKTRRVEGGEMMPYMDRARIRRDTGAAVKLIWEAVSVPGHALRFGPGTSVTAPCTGLVFVFGSLFSF